MNTSLSSDLSDQSDQGSRDIAQEALDEVSEAITEDEPAPEEVGHITVRRGGSRIKNSNSNQT